MSKEIPSVLFYHAHFFNESETFIYHQAGNPHVRTLLLSKRFINADKFSFEGFSKYRFKRSLADGLLSNLTSLAGIDRYYFGNSIRRMKAMLSDEAVDVIHAQFGFSGVRILPLARLMKKPLIVSFHGFDASRLLRKRPYRKALQAVFDYADAIIICNPKMEDDLPLSDRHRRKLHWVPYGIDLDSFTPAVRKHATATVRLLHVGRLVEKKGVPDLIRVFARLRTRHAGLRLDIVGSGLEEETCRILTKELQVGESVVFHGWKSPSEVKALMEKADIFVLNSRVAGDGDMEGLPNGILEAMAMNLPVVSTLHAGIPYAIGHGQEGLLVPEKDNNALEQAIGQLVIQESLRSEMGASARKKVEQQFTLKRMHLQLAGIYRSILS